MTLNIINIIKFILTTALCQFSYGKTAKCIDYIDWVNSLYKFSIDNGFIRNINDDTHHITFVLTNKSLPETKQWKQRLNDNKIAVVRVMSSKEDSEDKGHISFLDYITECDNREELPTTVVMCCHDTRIFNIIKIIKKLSVDFTYKTKRSVGIKHFRYSIMFDEADSKNVLQIINKFLKEIPQCEHNNIDDNYESNIHSVIFITATPFDKFWETLKKNNIDNLESINHIISECKEYESFESYDLLYRNIEDHNIIYVKENNDPIEFAKHVLNHNSFNSNSVKTVFAPSAIQRKTHDRMTELFLDAGYTVCVINGSFKGFKFLDGSEITIDQFKKDNNVENEELCYVLKKFRELYPNNNLAITGHKCIERGITFNTNGFQFTDSIISDYLSKDIGELIQFLGRSNGKKEYVDIHNIWISEKTYEFARKHIDELKKTQKENPQIFRKEHFEDIKKEKKTKKIKNDKRKTVPFYFELTDEEFNNIKSSVNLKERRKMIISIVNDKYNNINNENKPKFKDYAMKQISHCKTDDSIKKHIDDYIIHANNNTPYMTDLNHKDKDKKCKLYQIFYDDKRLILSFYDGDIL